MTKNPVLNALSALLYIGVVASIMFYGEHSSLKSPGLIVPVAMLSLFTLSAVVMGYIFFYQPIMLYLDGKKKQAVDLFPKTAGTFAGITLIIFLILYSGLIK